MAVQVQMLSVPILPILLGKRHSGSLPVYTQKQDHTSSNYRNVDFFDVQTTELVVYSLADNVASILEF